jgi:hypothetical protein
MGIWPRITGTWACPNDFRGVPTGPDRMHQAVSGLFPRRTSPVLSYGGEISQRVRVPAGKWEREVSAR